MTQKIYSNLVMTSKNIHKIFIPKKYYSENWKKNIEIQNFEPQKMTRAYVWMKISEYLGSTLIVLYILGLSEF